MGQKGEDKVTNNLNRQNPRDALDNSQLIAQALRKRVMQEEDTRLVLPIEDVHNFFNDLDGKALLEATPGDAIGSSFVIVDLSGTMYVVTVRQIEPVSETASIAETADDELPV